MLTPHGALTTFAVDSTIYTVPYIVLIVILSIIALVLVARFPSLRKPSRKSITFYVAGALVLILLVFQANNVTRRALVSYKVESDVKFYPETGKHFNMTCRNQGDKFCSFTIAITSVNASFPVQSIYVQVNSTSIRVPFQLSEKGLTASETTEPIIFDIDENVTGFSFTFFPVYAGGTDLVFVMGDTYRSYIWNGTENCYITDDGGGFIV
jgi:hypothetical protein